MHKERQRYYPEGSQSQARIPQHKGHTGQTASRETRIQKAQHMPNTPSQTAHQAKQRPHPPMPAQHPRQTASQAHATDNIEGKIEPNRQQNAHGSERAPYSIQTAQNPKERQHRARDILRYLDSPVHEVETTQQHARQRQHNKRCRQPNRQPREGGQSIAVRQRSRRGQREEDNT